MYVLALYLVYSGQTKQFSGRNTKTETRPLEKAEISAERLFRPKQPFLAETASLFRPTFWPNICCQNSLFRAKRLFWQNKVFWPKAEKEESQNTETETCFGQNFWPKPNRNCFGFPTTSITMASHNHVYLGARTRPLALQSRCFGGCQHGALS